MAHNLVYPQYLHVSWAIVEVGKGHLHSFYSTHEVQEPCKLGTKLGTNPGHYIIWDSKNDQGRREHLLWDTGSRHRVSKLTSEVHFLTCTTTLSIMGISTISFCTGNFMISDGKKKPLPPSMASLRGRYPCVLAWGGLGFGHIPVCQ